MHIGNDVNSIRVFVLALLLLTSQLSAVAVFYDIDFSRGDSSISKTYGNWFQTAHIKSDHNKKTTTIKKKGHHKVTKTIELDHLKHIRYNCVGSVLYRQFGFNPYDLSGCIIGIGYHHAELFWRSNPLFEKVNYNNATVGLGYFTQCIDNWRWLFQANLNVDTDRFSIGNYSTYDFLAWGRYASNPCLTFHLGAYTESGLKLDRIYPIVGFDWWFHPCWQLYAIFPFKFGLAYNVDNRLSVSVRSRFFTDRQRAFHQDAAWRYTNAGVELNLHHNHDEIFTAECYAGYAMLGRLEVTHIKHAHRRHFHIRPSTYLGAILTLKF